MFFDLEKMEADYKALSAQEHAAWLIARETPEYKEWVRLTSCATDLYKQIEGVKALKLAIQVPA